MSNPHGILLKYAQPIVSKNFASGIVRHYDYFLEAEEAEEVYEFMESDFAYFKRTKPKYFLRMIHFDISDDDQKVVLLDN